MMRLKVLYAISRGLLTAIEFLQSLESHRQETVKELAAGGEKMNAQALEWETSSPLQFVFDCPQCQMPAAASPVVEEDYFTGMQSYSVVIQCLGDTHELLHVSPEWFHTNVILKNV